MMKRRDFITTAAASTAAAGATAASSSFPAPAIAQERREWRMVTAWPKGFPGLGTTAELLGRLLTEGSDGRLTVTVYGAGEIVPAFEAIDAVQRGAAEIGHGAPYYWKGKVSAAQFLSNTPFGLTAQEQNAWYQYGGGQELADEIYAQMGCKFFPAGNTGVQMGGWFNKEINAIEDFRGLKIRIPGLGGEVLKTVGANVVNLPGGEIMPALQSGAIDATDWVSPYNDLAFGLYRTARYYYYPGWHEPCATVDCFINLRAWEELPGDLQSLVRTATTTVNQAMLNEYVARNNTALRALVEEHGVDLRAFSDDILTNLGRISGEVLEDIAAADPLSRRVFDSILRFRDEAADWTRISELSFLLARALPYDFPRQAG